MFLLVVIESMLDLDAGTAQRGRTTAMGRYAHGQAEVVRVRDGCDSPQPRTSGHSGRGSLFGQPPPLDIDGG